MASPLVAGAVTGAYGRAPDGTTAPGGTGPGATRGPDGAPVPRRASVPQLRHTGSAAGVGQPQCWHWRLTTGWVCCGVGGPPQALGCWSLTVAPLAPRSVAVTR
jgi:hypothetical protein